MNVSLKPRLEKLIGRKPTSAYCSLSTSEGAIRAMCQMGRALAITTAPNRDPTPTASARGCVADTPNKT